VGKADDAQNGSPTRSQHGDEGKRESSTPDGPTDRLSVPSSETFRQPTPELVDDPTRFESAKQKKTTLLEGLKKFNFKPKRVCTILFDIYFSLNAPESRVLTSLFNMDLSQVERLWTSPRSY
jgi:brefeldin A-inhibited guanine nucleotide-exchange protein